jgi:predicted N-acyltransferase
VVWHRKLSRCIHVQIGKQEWNALAHAADELNPFLLFEFLAALEDSGSVTPEEGWLPQHLTIRHHATGDLVAAIPAYIKGHSYGEYVFDQSWANLHQQLGARYYPKLQVRPNHQQQGDRCHAGSAPDLRGHKWWIGIAYASVQQQTGGLQKSTAALTGGQRQTLLGLAQQFSP